MAYIGVRKPYAGIYNYNEATGKVTYTKGARIAKAVGFEAETNTNEDNNLYADDGIAESDTSFAGGSLKITTDDLETESAVLILGAETEKITIGSEEVTEIKYNEGTEPPDMGFGIIIPKKKNAVLMYRAIFFHKIKFAVPPDAATTQGDSIEWQTPELSATMMRDDTSARGWKSEVTVKSEENAVAYLEGKLGITQQTP